MKTGKLCAGIVTGLILMSFVPLGGESFTLHINGKEVLAHYFTNKAVTPTVALNPASVTDKVSVYYNECGKIGTSRRLILKDGQNKVLKEWTYANVSGEHTPMSFTVNELVTFKTSGPFKLIYSSKEVAREQLLALLTLDSEIKAMGR